MSCLIGNSQFGLKEKTAYQKLRPIQEQDKKRYPTSGGNKEPIALSPGFRCSCHDLSGNPRLLRPSDIAAPQSTVGNTAIQQAINGGVPSGLSSASRSRRSRKNVYLDSTALYQLYYVPSLIQRAPAGMVTEKTHLRKPNRSKTAPRKLPAAFNRVGPALNAGDKVELLSQKVMGGANRRQFA